MNKKQKGNIMKLKMILTYATLALARLTAMENNNSLGFSFIKKILTNNQSNPSSQVNYRYSDKERGISIDTHGLSENLYYRKEEKGITSMYDQTDKEVFTFEKNDHVYALSYNPHEHLIAYNNKLDKKEKQAFIFITNEKTKKTEEYTISSFAENIIVSNDGKSVIIVPSSKPIIIFDIETKKERKYLEPIDKDKEYWYSVDCNSDFTYFAASTDPMNQIYIYTINAPTQKPLEFKTDVYDLKFSAHDSNLLASCYGDLNSSSAKIWNIQEQKCIKRLVSPNICAVAWHPNGRIIATGHGDGSIELWDWENEKLLGKLHDESFSNVIISLSFNKEGDWIMARDYAGHVGFWNKK